MSLTSREDALNLRQGKRLVFTNGVFDILHAGHVRYLDAARQLGDILIVGMNADESVRMLSKGPDRPINPLEDRAEVLSALKAVDAVVAFNESTPIELIKYLQPDIHVKGGDYDADLLPETPIIRAYGGEIVIMPTLEGRSTTNIWAKLQRK